MRRPLAMIALAGLAAILGSAPAASAAAPSVVTSDAYSTSATTAIVEGQGDPGGESTTYKVQYDVASSAWCASGGTSGSPGNTIGPSAATSTAGSVSFIVNSGLAVGTSYCAQLVATNGSGEADGGQVQWTQGPGETVSVNLEGNGGGIVTSSPAGIACGDKASACAFPFRPGTAVSLTATPAPGSAFAGWSGACSGTGTCTIPGTTVEADLTATFNQLPPSTITVEFAGNGSGTVTSSPGIGSPGEIDCSSAESACSAQFLGGEQVTLTASPGSASNFAGWSGGDCSGAGSTCTFTPSGDTVVTAEFSTNSPPPPTTTCIVPKVTGKTLSAARKAITSHHCGVGKITKVNSTQKNKGHVVSQTPKPGKHLKDGSKVALKVGK